MMSEFMWTPKRDAALRRMRAAGKSYFEIGAAFGCHHTYARRRGRMLGLASDSRFRQWTPAEDAVIVAEYSRHFLAGTLSVLRRRLKVGVTTLRSRARALGVAIRRFEHTPTTDEVLIRMHAEGRNDSEIAARLACGRDAVLDRRKKLGLPRVPSPRLGCGVTIWTPAADAALASVYATATSAGLDDLAARMGVKRRALHDRAEHLGLRRPTANGAPRWMAESKEFAAAYGLPDDLRTLEVLILLTLLATGPATRREIAERMGNPGRRFYSSRHAAPGGGTISPFPHLTARGFIVALPPLAHRAPWRFSLTARALAAMASSREVADGR